MTTFVPSYTVLEEPKLRFHATEPRYTSISPIEGLRAWGPYDASVPGSLTPNPLRLAIVSPERSLNQVIAFLGKLGQSVGKTSGDEYVEQWPGWRSVFQSNLEVPGSRDDPLVQLVPEDSANKVRKQAQPEVAFLDALKNHIRPLLARRHEFDVLVVYIPERWADFRVGSEPGYDFDLHDSLKVFGTPNGLTIQVIEEHTLKQRDQARVMWWLGLALYVKGNGTPWKLVDSSPDTAFVGVSYGISRSARNERMILGCSQVFDEQGEGLRFLLYPVESPVFRGKNPFMSREDARRLFGLVRDIYQETRGERPRRVVVHKTTHFTGAEMEGAAEALSGIEEIELLQVQQEANWRAIGWDAARQSISNFPVKRGTIIPLDPYRFLLWTQGDVLGIAGGSRHYYQEKRGIPSPLVVRRFRGQSPIEQIAIELLRLTKMNWNNHQLYSRLPVTISFSNTISQIAKQVQQVWRVPYDFRYFM